MKKKFKKVLTGVLALAMVVTSLQLPGKQAEAAGTENGNSLRLWYDEPASKGTNILSAGSGYSDSDGSNTWQQQTLPIGNGDMGANVYGEITSEHLTFNEKTLWTGGPSDSREDYNGGNLESSGNYGATIEQIQGYFAEGNDTAASSLCGSLVGTSTGYGAYQAWGDIYFDYKDITEGNVTNYQRDLDLKTALSSVSFTENGTDYTREFFVSNPDNVLVGHLEADGDATLNLDVRFTSKQGATAEAIGNNTLKVAGQVGDNQLKYASYLTVVTDDGTVTASGSKLTVEGAASITVYVSAATDYENTFYNEETGEDYYYRTGETDEALAARVKADVDAAVEKGYTDVKADHLADYQELFNRVSLDLGQTVSDKTTDQLLAAYKAGTATDEEQRQLEVMLFQYGRYLTIASSRENSQLPSNLQGVWNYSNNPPWSSDYHMNVNLQMNYWPTYSTNLAECAEPLIDYVDSLREPGRVTAAVYAGVVSEGDEENGFMAHTQNTPFGWTCPGWSFDWGWSPAAVPWILQNCWEYYEYTGDLEYMEEYIYPMLKEEAKLYDAMLVEDEDGYLVSSPSYSPEHGPRTAGNTYEQSLIWQLYEDTITAAELVSETDTELVEGWKSNQANLKGPIEIGDDAQIKEWYNETTFNTDENGNTMGEGYGHRHISHMLGLFPGDLIQTNDEWIEAARVSMENRTDNSTGWGMGQRINTWARLGDGNKAHELIQNLFKGGIYPNLWDAHAPFQIDGNFGMTSGVAEMLVQSNMGYINLLPALPDAWADGNVEGLVARGNFEIGMTWETTSLTETTILSNNGGECVVEYPTITEAKVVDSTGKEVEVTVVEGENRISFDTVAGETYTIKEIPERPLDAPENAEAIYAGSDAVVYFDESALATEYTVYASTDGESYTKLVTISTTEYKDTDYVSGKTYKVAAVGDNGEGELSDVITPELLDITNKIDDRDERIKYNGFNNWGPQDGQYMGTEKYTSTVGATAEFYFYGNAVRVIAMKNTDCHTFDLYVDNAFIGTIDTNASSCQRQQTVAEVDELTEGIHKVKIVVKQGKVSLDAFEFDAAVVAAGLEITGEDSLNMNVSATMQLTADYTPSGAAGAGVNWSVDKEAVATIDANGLLTAVKPGTVVVTATDKADSSLTASKTITITKEATTVKYDDRDLSITYTGSWYTWNDSKHYSGTDTETTANGDSFTFSFEGTGIALYVMKIEKSGNTGGAQLAISIDGGEAVNVSTFTTVVGSEAQQKIFENLDLANGTHTVTVTVNGIAEDAQAAGVTSPKVAFDYYEVTIGGDEPECTHENTEVVNAKAATCTEAGYTGDTVCEDCGETVEAGETITATGHAYGDWEVTKAATCTEAGEETRACANDAKHVETREVEATGHAYGDWKVTKAATCTEAGEETRTCANDAKHVETREVEATGHTFGDWTVVTPATEEAEGLEERVCACGEKETRAIEKLPAQPVDPDKDPVEDTDKDADKDSAKEESKSPTTGDNTSIIAVVVVMLVCVAAVAVVLVRKKRTK